MEELTVRVGEDLELANPMRVDAYLSKELPDLSRSVVQRLLKEKRITCNEKHLDHSSYKIKCGDEYRIQIPEPEPIDIIPQDIPLNIVHEDDDIIVLDKHAGLVVHPGFGNPKGTLVNALVHHCGGDMKSVGDALRPGIVHRLDKDTTGLMVVAKNEKAHRLLSRDMLERKVEKKYLALCWGTPKENDGFIEANIARDKHNRKIMRIVSEDSGRYAATHYSVQKIFLGGLLSLVECKLVTGRTHQIRVHMAHLRCNIVGDKDYKKRRLPKAHMNMDIKIVTKFHRQALHSHILRLTHPITKENMEFKSELPKDIADIIVAIDT